MIRKLIAAAILVCSTPGSAQVKVDQLHDLDWIKPSWVRLSDGSDLAIMTSPDLNTAALLRCWDEGTHFACIKATENWVTGYPHLSAEWIEREDRSEWELAIPQSERCSQIMTRRTDDGSVDGCERLIDAMFQGGLLALARLPRSSLE